jgi:spore coat protein CotF
VCFFLNKKYIKIIFFYFLKFIFNTSLYGKKINLKNLKFKNMVKPQKQIQSEIQASESILLFLFLKHSFFFLNFCL